MIAGTDLQRIPLKRLDHTSRYKQSATMDQPVVTAVRSAVQPPAPEKKKKEKLSSLCKTPPSTIKARGQNYKRGLCLGEVRITNPIYTVYLDTFTYFILNYF